MNELVSVVVPIYKVEQYLDRCVNSILNQTYKNIEIILVDDGSPDLCGRMCDEFKERDSRIKVIHQSNQGLSAARNSGLSIAGGKYILFIDSDDYINENMIEKLLKLAIQEGADIVSCGHVQIYDNAPMEYTTKGDFNIALTPKEALKSFLFTHIVDVVTWNKLYNIKLFDDVQFKVGKLYEDHYTIYKLIDKANKVVYTSETLYYYCKRNTSIGGVSYNKNTMQLKDALDEECEYILKKYPDMAKEINLGYVQWMLVIIDKMLLADAIDKEFLKYIKKKAKKCFPFFIKTKELYFKQKVQLFLFILNFKLYSDMYKLYYKKRRG